ncbi:hypothetical protein GCM10010232_38460 [Streptomyces amakusaensis]
MRHSALGEPSGHVTAEPSGSAGDQYGAGGRPPGCGAPRQRSAYDPAAVRLPVAERDLVLPGRAAEQRDQPVTGGPVAVGRQVDQSAPAGGALQRRDPAEPPQRRLVRAEQRIAVAGGHRAPGQAPQRGGKPGVAHRLVDAEQRCEAGGARRSWARTARDEDDAVGGGGGQPLGEVGSVAGRGEGEFADPRPGGAQGVRHVLGGVAVVGGDDQPGSGEGASGGAGERLPPCLVAPGFEDGLLAQGLPPGRQRRYEAGQVSGVVAQSEGVGEFGEVRSFHRLPEPVLVRRGGRLGGARVGAGQRLGPVALALEGVGRQLDPVALGEQCAPVDLGSGGPQAGESGQSGGGVVAVLAQHGGENGFAEGLLGHRAEHSVGAQLHEPGDALIAQPCHPVGEPDRLPHLPHPVLRVRHQTGLGHIAGQVGHHGDDGVGEVQLRQHGGEVGQHGFHQRGVERVRDRQPAGAAPLPRPAGRQRVDRLLGAGDHHRRGAVDRGDVGLAGDRLDDLGLGRLDGEHRAARGQRLHQPAACGDEPAGVGQREDSGAVGGRDLADRVPQQDVRDHAPGFQQPECRDLDGEQAGLRPFGPIELGSAGEHDVLERAFTGRVQFRADRVEGLGEHGERLVQPSSHARALCALAGEEEPGPALVRRSRDHAAGRARGGQRPETGEQFGLVGAEHHGAACQRRPGRRQRPCHIGRTLRAVRQPAGEAFGLCAQRLGRLRGHRPEQGSRRRDGARGRRVLGRRAVEGRSGCFLKDQMGVGSADAERGDRDPPRLVRTGPWAGVGEQADAAALPLDVGGGDVGVQGARQQAVAERQHALDDADHA